MASTSGVDAWSGQAYDSTADAQHRWGLEVAARVAPETRTLLDVGCGPGRITKAVLENRPDIHVTALDASPSMLEVARSTLAAFPGRVRYVLGDIGRRVDLENHSFDCVLSTGTLHWVLDHRWAFSEVARLLAAGGDFIAQCGGAGSLQAVRERLGELGIATEPLNRYADAEETSDLLRDCGFVDVWCWLEPRAVSLPCRDALIAYVEAAALSPYLTGLAPDRRRAVVEEVADEVPDLVLQFVRLNILARTGERPRRDPMNEVHLQLCSSPEWAAYVRDELLPWALAGRDLGDDVLELGPGPGLTTEVLVGHVPRLTALEVDRDLAERLAERMAGSVDVIWGDATASGLPSGRFSAVTCFTMLHHVPSADLQDRLFAEVARLLQPGGLFLGTDSIDTPDLRSLHVDDTFVPVDPATLAVRLASAGLEASSVEVHDHRVRFTCRAPA